MSDTGQFYRELRAFVASRALELDITQAEAIGALSLLTTEIGSDVLIQNGILAGGVVSSGGKYDV